VSVGHSGTLPVKNRRCWADTYREKEADDASAVAGDWGGGSFVRRHLIRIAYTLSALVALVMSLGAGRKWM
jgi:hypothetical protein